MPERPDLDLYATALERRLAGRPLRALRVTNPFLLRTTDPPPEAFAGRELLAVSRQAKRLVLEFEEEHYAALHLMSAGRLHWREGDAGRPRRPDLLVLEGETGSAVLTERARKKRASLHLLRGSSALAALDPGGVEIVPDGFEAFAAALARENHTLKRALTDQRIVAGVGNAFSDEILWTARLSPFRQTRSLEPGETAALFFAALSVLEDWTARLAREAGDAFPTYGGPFREGTAVHGRAGAPCPRCAAPVQRIVRGDRETNYCARCQTGGRILADRALSRLLHDAWPRRIEDLEG
ncbi:MAG: DNA-formamidopyrimidine glycosylase family protein [Pseudomonadales bacterium]|jgi:formamidopyrimidine-DNA glycosylase|nr:DNA-formamidopyrimidine glycosylase family protein [Pseudomonadales bacterium]